MNAQIKRLWQLIVILFFILALATTYIQFVCTTNLLGADYNLTNHPRNSRGTQRAKYVERGPIFVGDKKLVSSVPDPKSTGYRKQYRRVYGQETRPYSHLIGYLAPTGGGFGLELIDNSILMGESGANIFSRSLDTITGKHTRGNGIRLTIDPAMQEAAYEALKGRKGAAVAINYQTGAILALVSTPSYNLNELANKPAKESQVTRESLEKDANKPLLNRALQGSYFPGSSFKLITAAVAIERDNYTPTTQVDAPRSVRYPTNPRASVNNIRDEDGQVSDCGNGHPQFQEAFARSCNTPFAIIGRDIGQAALLEKAEAFGFNAKNTLKIPLTVAKSKFPTKDLGDYRLQLAIGQNDVQTNPLLMATVAGAMANEGVQITPYLVSEITTAEGKAIRTFKGGKQMGTPVTKEVAAQIKTMMKATVEADYGTGRKGKVAGVEMGAKTGTAETGSGPNSPTYAWFVGYALPNNIPIAYAVIVEGDENRLKPHGGPDAGPVAAKMIAALKAEAVRTNG